MKRVFNFGSLNIDHVYRVRSISRPGEAVPAADYHRFAGGKGANQSFAIARAGGSVAHMGKIGPEGRWMLGPMNRDGVDTSHVLVGDEPGGHAIIQVDDQGENSIVVYGGSNRQISRDEIDAAFSFVQKDDVILLQNEISEIPHIIEQAAQRDLPVFLNAAPMDKDVCEYPLSLISAFFINQLEGSDLTGETDTNLIVEKMKSRFPESIIVLTLGRGGCLFDDGKTQGCDVDVVDTTGAGDTFIGYFMAAVCRGGSLETGLKLANQAASICVSRSGAADSIPYDKEVGR